MEYRFVGKSGLQVSELSFGTMTFGGADIFRYIGSTQLAEARRFVDIALEAGVNLFDTADAYSSGLSEEILGQAIGKERRSKVVIATKGFMRTGPGVHDVGLSKLHLIQACEASLKRLNTDYIDLYQVHLYDALTPLEETLSALDQLVRDGKVRYIGNSNFSAWQSMKAEAIAEKHDYQHFISQQVYYSLLARDMEMELMPFALDQHVGTLVWSPLSFGLLSGKYKRGRVQPEGTRLSQISALGPVDLERLYHIETALEKLAKERKKTIPQIALRWLLQRPSISSVIIGARNEEQFRENLGATGWSLTPEEMNLLNKASDMPETYPTWHQRKFGLERNPRLNTMGQT